MPASLSRPEPGILVQITETYYRNEYGARFGVYVSSCDCGCNGAYVKLFAHPRFAHPDNRATRALIGSHDFIIIPDRED